jgi:hypothetical protein
MAKEKAIEICKNLKQTLSNMNLNYNYNHVDSTFDKPGATRNILKRRLSTLIDKYKINKKEL